MFIETAGQQDRDVIAGCQYYYESKSVGVNTKDKGEEDTMDEVMRMILKTKIVLKINLYIIV